MNGKTTVEKPDSETDVAVEPNTPHPLDSWLKRELQTLYGASEREALPPEIAKLAARLEQRLRDAEGDPGGDGTPGKPPGHGRAATAQRTSKWTTRGSKR